jgi:hypothetical protein
MHWLCLRMIVVLSVLALPLAATDENLLRLTRPDPNFILGVRLTEVSRSPLVKTMIEEALASKPEWQTMLAAAGATSPQDALKSPLSLIEGFDEILVTANVDGRSPQEPKDVLVLFRGAFSQGRLEKMFCGDGCERAKHRGFELIKVERKDADAAGYLVVLDDQYAALGERPAVERAIERYRSQTPAALSPTMQGWVDRLGRYHLWMAAKGPFHTPGSEEPGPAAMAATAAAKMEGFGLGLLLDRDVSLSVELESASDDDARQLYEMVQGVVALGRASGLPDPAPAASGPAGSGAFNLLENLKVANAGRVVSASLTIPQRELTRQMLAKLKERRPQGEPASDAGLRAGGMRRPAAVAIAGGTSQPGVIRVYGLATRPVEYPLTSK